MIIRYAILFVLFFLSHLYADTLNIITDSKDAKIYINNRFKAKYELLDYSILPGTYLITVKESGLKVFSEIIEIDQDKVKTLNISVNTLLNTDVISIRDKKQLAQYVLDKGKGDLGFGLYFSGTGMSGLKASYDVSNTVTLQSVFWMSYNDQNEVYNAGIKAIRYFKNQYTKHSLARLYTGMGYLYGEHNGVKRRNIEIPFGLEFKFRGNINPLPSYSFLTMSYVSWIYNMAISIDGMYYFVESGLTYNEDSFSDYYYGIKFAMGFQYYF
tara:strand:- start:11 stop:820 length:810 start_codon:yes stop_codon:yes gene_type:complete